MLPYFFEISQKNILDIRNNFFQISENNFLDIQNTRFFLNITKYYFGYQKKNYFGYPE